MSCDSPIKMLSQITDTASLVIRRDIEGDKIHGVNTQLRRQSS